MNPNPGDKPLEESYKAAARMLESQFRYGLTPAEAVDYLAVQKATCSTGDWADVRGVEHSTISGNISSAKEKINTRRTDAEILSEDDDIVVRVSDREGDRHKLPFSRTTTIMGHPGEATLKLVYESHSAIHGYYEDEDGEGFEATLWYDGRPSNSFEEFDHFDEWGSPQAKADIILWEREDE